MLFLATALSDRLRYFLSGSFVRWIALWDHTQGVQDVDNDAGTRSVSGTPAEQFWMHSGGLDTASVGLRLGLAVIGVDVKTPGERVHIYRLPVSASIQGILSCVLELEGAECRQNVGRKEGAAFVEQH